MSNEEIKITGEPTLDPNVCKFVVDRSILEDGSYTCRSKEMASGSPLLEALFAIDGISQVSVNGDSLTIAKSTHDAWPALGKSIGEAIRNQFASGQPLINIETINSGGDDDRIRERVEQLFTNDINPALASHGGRVELADVQDGKVYVRLGGGCQGCSSANATLKQGIAKAIKEVLPEVTEVLDATDHAAGATPYYQ